MHVVSSEDVNDYIREAAGSDAFSAKDFRTWAATLLAFRVMDATSAVKLTAEVLGDTPTVTRNSYIHPAVLAGIETAVPAPGAIDPPDALEPPKRRDELALLAFLRRRPSGGPKDASATRPKAGARSAVARSRGRAA